MSITKTSSLNFCFSLSNDACRATPYKSLITSNMICAAAPGTDACQGDSGGKSNDRALAQSYKTLKAYLGALLH